MSTTSSTTKAKPDNQNLTRSRSLGRKPKQPSSSVSSEDGSDQKLEKPLPNYLKPTISSRPDPVKFLKKNNNSLDDNQKLLRRRSFDRPPSSLTSPSTSSPRIQKSLNVSPARTRDRPAVPRDKPVPGLRSSSFHGGRSVPRGSSTLKSSPVAPKKSGLSGSSSSLKSKKEGSENVKVKKPSDKEFTSDSASLSSAQEDDQEEILKVESDVQVADHGKEESKEDELVQVEVVQADDESTEEKKEFGGPTTIASTAEGDSIAVIKDVEEKLINEDKTEEKIIDETNEQENNKREDEEELKSKTDDKNETPDQKKLDIETKEVESVEETTKEKEEEVKVEEKEKVTEEETVKEEEEKEKVIEEETVKEEEKEKVTEEEKVKEEEEKEKVIEKEEVKEEESGEAKKREVMKAKKESPSAYNDVIASKMQENPRKNKVLALAGAFQTVIDYETAASK